MKLNNNVRQLLVAACSVLQDVSVVVSAWAGIKRYALMTKAEMDKEREAIMERIKDRFSN